MAGVDTRNSSPTGGKELVLSTEKDGALFDLVGAPVVVFDAKSVLFANTALCGDLGRIAAEIIGTPLRNWLNDESAAFVESLFARFERPGESMELADIRLVGPKGSQRWMSGRFVSVSFDGRKALAGFLTDLEDQKRSRAVEEHFRQSQKMEAVGRLAGGVAHDMNNVLGAIMGFASVIQAELPSGSHLQEDVRHVLESCRKGRDLMLNLLGFARRGKYRMEQFTLNERVEDVVKLLKRTIPKKIKIDVRLAQRPMAVYGDPTQIHHALMNMCLNAVDAMGDAGVLTIISDSIAVEDGSVFSPDVAAGKYARLRISDTGTGMDGDVMAMAFEPFFTTKPLGRGSGLGLSMVYGTAVNHGGAVMLESAPNRGTVATLLLPPSSYESETIRTSSDRKPSSDADQATVLLVDDEKLVRRAGQRALEKLGYKVILAEDGLAAVRVFAEQRDAISAVMLDLIMPVMDGAETFEKIKEIDPHIPVLLASGYSREEQAEALIKKGANGFIQKPYDLATLRVKLGELFG